MKKIYPILFIVLAVASKAQTGSIQLIDHQSSVTIAPNATIQMVTVPGPEFNVSKTFDVKNTSTTFTNTYDLKRYDIIIHSLNGEFARPNFCFASVCYSTDAVTNYVMSLVLKPGQNSAELPESYSSLDADMTDLESIGYSVVKYTIYNANNVSDSIQITMRYNDLTTSIAKNQAELYGLRIYPNPATESTNIYFNAPMSGTAKMSLVNMIGQTIRLDETSIQVGPNKLNLDVKGLSPGIYFIELETSSVTITKKLTIARQ